MHFLKFSCEIYVLASYAKTVYILKINKQQNRNTVVFYQFRLLFLHLQIHFEQVVHIECFY